MIMMITNGRPLTFFDNDAHDDFNGKYSDHIVVDRRRP